MPADQHLLDPEYLRSRLITSAPLYNRALTLLNSGSCTLKEQHQDRFRVLVEDLFEDFLVQVDLSGDKLDYHCPCASALPCCHHAAAALLYLARQREQQPSGLPSHIQYTREEMIARVLEERRQRAELETYHIDFADNVYGVHRLTAASGQVYQLTLRDFDRDVGYCSCPDYRTNKLGTCKHLIALFRSIRRKYPVEKYLQSQAYPFVEIYCDPQKSYHITYFYKGSLSFRIAALLEKYFPGDGYVYPEQYDRFIEFLGEVEGMKKVVVRPEVLAKIEKYVERQFLVNLSQSAQPDFSSICQELLPFQKEAVFQAVFSEGLILADAPGLGADFQAAATAIVKRELLGFQRCLVITTEARIKKWERDIRRWSGEEARVCNGPSRQREEAYQAEQPYFRIASYAAIREDVELLRQIPVDVIILDEAQQIKDYSTPSSMAVKALPKKHALVVCPLPLHQRLGDLYSIMNFIDPEILAPLWEFSMNHCYFDRKDPDRITGYYNLEELRQRIAPWYLRRTRADVAEQLADAPLTIYPVSLSTEQAALYNQRVETLRSIASRKRKTVFDWQRSRQLLGQLQRVTIAARLIAPEKSGAAKLTALRDLLLDQIDLANQTEHVLVVSQWPEALLIAERSLELFPGPKIVLTADQATDLKALEKKAGAPGKSPVIYLVEDAALPLAEKRRVGTIIHLDYCATAAGWTHRRDYLERSVVASTHPQQFVLVAVATCEEAWLAGDTLEYPQTDTDLNTLAPGSELPWPKAVSESFWGAVLKQFHPVISSGISREKIPAGVQQTRLFSEVELAGEAEQQRYAFREKAEAEQTPLLQKTIPKDELENTLNNGLQFLSGLIKMSTGREILPSSESIQFDPETGEVVLKFKLPEK